MKINVQRLKSDPDATIGFLTVDSKPMCFTLEDEHRDVKVMDETRIPSGVYEIKLRDAGGITKKYASKYPDIHKGMLWLQDVPNFEWVYIHVGNTDDHTSGCLLVGNSANLREGNKTIGSSVDAYKELYVLVADAIESGEPVFIEIIDNDR